MKRIIFISVVLCFLFVLSITVVDRVVKHNTTLIKSKVNATYVSTDNNYVPAMPELETIFAKDHTWTATLSANRIRTVLVTGDILPARSVNVRVLKQNDPLWPYEKVLTRMHDLKPDITFANLETPLLRDCEPTVEGMIFCGSDRNVAGLKAINVTVATLANNHTANHNVAGVLETIQVLQENNIGVTGINGPYIKDIRGIKFAFLGYNDISTPQPGIANVSESLITNEIAEAKKRADVVIVQYHWGAEYRAQPDERQKYLAHFTIDQGADLVLSNHPHWIQPVELYKDKLIMYAHGNFIFDQMWSEETKKGVLGLYTFYDTQLISVQYFPVYIEDFGQARFMEGDEADKVLEDLKMQSLLLSNE